METPDATEITGRIGLQPGLALTAAQLRAALGHSGDQPGARLDQHRPAPNRIGGAHCFGDGLLGGLLSLRVDESLDGQAAALEPILPLLRGGTQRGHLIGDQDAPDVVAEHRELGDGATVRGFLHVGGIETLLHGGLRLLLRDHPDLGGSHPLQHLVAALDGFRGVLDRIEGDGVLDDARQHRCLGEGQVLGGRVPVVVGRRFDPVGAVPVVGDVQVAFQDLVLAETLLDRHGVAHLTDLAFDADGLRGRCRILVTTDQSRLDLHLLHVLLGEGGCTLGGAAEGPEDGASQTLDVDGAVLVEPVILDGDLRLLHQRGDLIEGDVGAVLREEVGQF